MAYSIVQSSSVQAFGASTVSRAFGANVVSGNLLIVAGAAFNITFGPAGCADTRATVYARDAFVTATSAPQHTAVFSGAAPTSGACTVTLTASGSNNPTIAIHEFSGLAAASWVDVTRTGGSASPDNPHVTGASATTAQAAELVFVADSHSSGGVATATVSTGYAKLEEIDLTAGIPIVTAHKRVTATGTQSASVAWISADYAVVLVSYKEDGGGADAVPAIRAPLVRAGGRTAAGIGAGGTGGERARPGGRRG